MTIKEARNIIGKIYCITGLILMGIFYLYLKYKVEQGGQTTIAVYTLLLLVTIVTFILVYNGLCMFHKKAINKIEEIKISVNDVELQKEDDIYYISFYDFDFCDNKTAEKNQ